MSSSGVRRRPRTPSDEDRKSPLTGNADSAANEAEQSSAASGADSTAAVGGQRDKSKGGDSSTSHSPDDQTRALGVLFFVAIILMLLLFANFPAMSEDDWQQLRFPWSTADLKRLSSFLMRYRDENFTWVLSGFCSLYIFLQAFAIPGAIFLSVLAGPLFGVAGGLVIVSLVATTGSAICYLISHFLGRRLVQRCLPSQLKRFRGMVDSHRHNLFFYMLFLRISPLLPNWFISVASPILDVPLTHFAGATFLGLIPANYIHVTTGLTLNEMGASDSVNAFNPKKLLFLLFIALFALIPTLFRKKFEELDAKMAASGAAPKGDNAPSDGK